VIIRGCTPRGGCISKEAERGKNREKTGRQLTASECLHADANPAHFLPADPKCSPPNPMALLDDMLDRDVGKYIEDLACGTSAWGLSMGFAC